MHMYIYLVGSPTIIHSLMDTCYSCIVMHMKREPLGHPQLWSPTLLFTFTIGEVV